MNDQAQEIRRRLTDPEAICRALGIEIGEVQRNRVTCRCPVHQDGGRPNAMVSLREDGTIGWNCFHCQTGGDVLHLIGAVLGVWNGGLLRGPAWRAVMAKAEELAGSVRQREAPPPKPRGFPLEASLQRFWESLLPPAKVPAVVQALGDRGLDAAQLHHLARAIPPGHGVPDWAQVKRRTWVAEGYSLVLPMWDHEGIQRSVHARRFGVKNDDRKGVSPTGCTHKGLIFATPLGVELLQSGKTPSGGVAVCEGIPDFLTLATQPELQEAAVLGVIAGSWSKDFADRIPDQTPIVVWTHTDATKDKDGHPVEGAGQKYRARVISSFEKRCPIRVVPQEAPEKGKAPDINDHLRQGGRKLVAEMLAKAALPGPKRPPGGGEGQLRWFDQASDVELAQALLEDLEKKRPLAYDGGRVLTYEASLGIWRDLSHEEMVTEMRTYDGCPKGDKGRLCLGLRQMEAAVRLARYTLAQRFPPSPGFLSSAQPGLAVQNGFLRITAAGVEVLPHSPDHRATLALPLTYERDRPSPGWGRFLWEVLGGHGGDPAWVEGSMLLQEFAGACLCGLATRFQRCLFLWGEGNDGKSTAIDVIKAIFPGPVISAISPQGFSNEYRRAALRDARINAVAETPGADVLESESFKAVIDGSLIDARPIRQDPIKFRPQAGHIFAANSLPGTRDQSRGFWRRIMVLRFPRSLRPDEVEVGLSDRLIAEELPGVLAWALDGAVRLLHAGRYTEPGSSQVALQDWRRTADQVTQFVEEVLHITQGDTYGELPASSVYKEYTHWARENGHSPLNSTRFGERIKKILGSCRRRSGVVYFCLLRSKHGGAAGDGPTPSQLGLV